jgi:hypothetical protein
MGTEFSGGLPKGAIKLLGKTTDRAIAAQFGVSSFAVSAERRRRNIAAFNQKNWTAANIALLGKFPDQQVANRIGLSQSAVFTKRVSLGIAPCHQSRREVSFNWTSKALSRLGVVSDHVLSRELGISASVVTAKRNSLGVGPSRGVERTRKPWSKTELAMLGKKPDTWVAQKTGRGRRHVRAKRESLGIPPFQTQNWVEWNKATVAKIKSGKLTNAELARELGVSEGTVALHRRRMLQKDRRRR